MSAFRVQGGLAAAALACLTFWSVPAAGQEPGGPSSAEPSFRGASSELVVLPVVVTDQKGRLVGDLSADRFVVYDNDRPQPITFFTNDDTPVSVALVVDDSGSMAPKLGEVIAAAVTFVRASNPDDEVFAIEFNDSARDTLGGRTLNASDGQALADALWKLVPSGQTALYDALMMAEARLEKSTLSRKVMILVSDGGDNASHASLDAVLARARRSSVTIYAIGVFDPDDPDSDEGVLKRLASTTGGERFLPRSPGLLVQTCLGIAREIRSGYTIGFEPPAHDGTYHRLRVQAARAEGARLIVRTRPGYLAVKSDTP